MPTPPQDPYSIAQVSNAAQVASIQKRAESKEGVLRASLQSYDAWLERRGGEHPLLNLTYHLTSTLSVTETAIRQRMEQKWAELEGTAADIEKSVTNSLRRSAGTNYQGLVSYALAKYLLETGSHWYVVHPVPPGFGNSLAIRFTGGVTDLDQSSTVGVIPEEEPEAQEQSPAAVTVKPDVDVLLRNAAWLPSSNKREPIVLLSVKTSLADRAGAAARWKTYFDLVTRPCPNIDQVDCAYRLLGIELAYDPNVSITHGVVTANIYKINSDPYFAEWGELRSNQARSNTFMFDLRYTTRNESEKVMAEGWEALTELPVWLLRQSQSHGLPE